jgi:pimeloyl-ACP methyl ester carboxylesterase
MKRRFFAGFALAFSLACPVFAADAEYEAGALHVRVTGDRGPAVVLIPGLASGPWVWDATVERLRKDHVVYLLALPGFDGRKPVAGATFESLQGDLLALIEKRRLGKPVLVGHSLGGTLALAFAAGHSDRLAGVVAVDGLPVFPGTERMTGDRSALAAGARSQFGAQTREQFGAGQVEYMKRIGVLDAAQAVQLAVHTSRSDIGATAEMAAQLFALDLRPRLGQIKVPVVEISPFNPPDFAAMGIDEAGKADYYRALMPGIERLEVVSISPARHFVMFDQPEKFAAALDGALASMVESPAR